MKKLKYFLLNRFSTVFIINFLLSSTVFLHASDNSYIRNSYWSAFVSQTAIYSSDFNFLSRSDDRVSLDLWEAGILFTATTQKDVTFSGQLLGRRVSEYSDEDFRIDYAFVSYPFYQNYQDVLGVRLGRIRSSYGFYSETRDMPHSRVGVIMPQSVYFDRTRNMFFSSDGVEFYAYRDLGGYADRRLGFQFFISKPEEYYDEAKEFINFDINDVNGAKSILAKISYGSELEGFRLAFTYYKPEYDFAVTIPVSKSPLIVLEENNASVFSKSLVTSLEYNTLDWTLTGEYIRHKFFFRMPVLGEFSDRSYYEEAFYLQGLKRINGNWEAYLRYDSTELRGLNPVWRRFKDINIGLSFRPDEHWLIRTEFHYIKGAYARLLLRDNEFSAGSPQYWHAAMLQVAYRW